MTSVPETLESIAQSLVSPETGRFADGTCHKISVVRITTNTTAIAGPERRFELGKKLHSSLDILQTPTYSKFLKTFFPVFAQLLQQLPLQQPPDTPDHKLRWLIVDVLQRLPQSETVKPYINDLLRLALRVITSDNEENALKCMHIFSDVLRTHKPQDPDAAVMFLDFVKGVNITQQCQKQM